MAASYRITAVLFFLFSIPAIAQNLPEAPKPKHNIFKTTGHWVATHKKVVVISTGAALASGLTYNAMQSNTPYVIHLGPAVPCPGPACIPRH